MLGYSLSPFFIASLLLWLLEVETASSLNVILGAGAVVWSLLVMMVFLSVLIPRKRIALALYPVFLLNLYLFTVIVI